MSRHVWIIDATTGLPVCIALLPALPYDTAEYSPPDFAKPIAPLADWMRRAGDLIDEATPK